jgi:solute carrier organic anion transporter family protein 1B
VSMADAATLTAVTQVTGQLFGIVISGYLAKRVTSKTGFVYILIGTHLLALVVTPAYLLLVCNNQPIYGHDGDYGVPVNTTDICGCSGTENLLSCGDDGNLFLSPCYAGCKSVVGNLFTECSGLGEGNTTMNVVTGLCPTDCRTNFLIYIVLHAVHAVSWSMSSIPGQLLTLRMVDPRDRGFASSIFTFCSTIASIPAPNIFGRIIDGTCLMWKGNSCSLYDRDKIRYLLSGADIASSALIQFTILLTVYFFKKEEREDKAKLQEERRKKEEPVITTQL